MNKRKIASIAAAASAPALLSTVLITSAQAHGSMESPVSRVYACFQEGPESPDSAACKAAVTPAAPSRSTTGTRSTSATPPAGTVTIIPDGTAVQRRARTSTRPRHGPHRLAVDHAPRGRPASTSVQRHRAPPGHLRDVRHQERLQPAPAAEVVGPGGHAVPRGHQPALVNGDYVCSGQLPSGKTGATSSTRSGSAPTARRPSTPAPT